MRRLTGSITVFLSLVFLLVFALFGTLLETARYTVCKNHAARTLRTGAEGLLSEYNRPLYEHYGLFFIEKGGTPYEQVIGVMQEIQFPRRIKVKWIFWMVELMTFR